MKTSGYRITAEPRRTLLLYVFRCCEQVDGAGIDASGWEKGRATRDFTFFFC